MRIETKLLFVLSLLFSITASAQKINDNWVFGQHAGLTFSTDPPSPLSPTGSASDDPPPHFVSAISDKTGNLLFYTNGRLLWNAGHQLVPPTDWRWPWTDYTMPLVCPYPGNDSLHYLFGVAASGSHAGELVYLTIAAKPGTGRVAIVYPATADYYTVLQKNAAPLLAGTAHCNQKDTWILAYGGGSFHAFLVTKAGVSTAAIVSSVAPSVLPPGFDPGWGNLKFSANGERLVVPVVGDNTIVVFDFNNATGTISNPRKLRIPPQKFLEDAELSPDGSKLYLGAHEKTDPGLEQHNVFQMDLDAGSPSKIEATLYKLNDRADRAGCTPHDCFHIYRSLQLGPDGKIYVSMREVDGKDQDLTLSVIENTTKPAAEVLYLRNAVDVDAKYQVLNYNYIRSGSFSFKENGILVKRKTCKDQPVEFSLLTSNIDSVRWDFGDPASGAANTSNFPSSSHRYPAAGAYQVTAFLYTNCVVDTARKQVFLQDLPAVHVPDFIKDTTLCLGESLRVDVTQPGAREYVWENNMKNPQRLIEDTGLYSLRITNECSSDYRRFHVDLASCNCMAFVPTAFSPNKDRLNDVFKPSFQCPAKNYTFKVIDRWGGVVFQTDRPTEGWNGRLKEMDATPGVYAWLLQYTDPNTNRTVSKKGTVVLLR